MGEGNNNNLKYTYNILNGLMAAVSLNDTAM